MPEQLGYITNLLSFSIRIIKRSETAWAKPTINRVKKEKIYAQSSDGYGANKKGFGSIHYPNNPLYNLPSPDFTTLPRLLLPAAPPTVPRIRLSLPPIKVRG